MTLLHLNSRASGEFRVVSQETGRATDEGQTLSCVHCQRTWVVKPGSGRARGWCMKCNGPTCGGQACQTCVPFERQLAIIERRDALRRYAQQYLTDAP